METLPSEVITNVMEYLSVYDQRKIGLINKTFYHASLDPILLKKEIFHYRDPALGPIENTKYYMCVHSRVRESIDNNDVEIKLNNFKESISNSERKFFNLRLSGLRLQSINDTTIIEKLGNRIVSLYLIDVYCLSNVFLNSITSYCNNLKTLRLEVIHSALNIEACMLLVHLKSLTFKNCYISDDQFSKIILCAPKITHFGILYTQRSGTFDNYSNQIITTKAVTIYLQNATNINNLEVSGYKWLFNLPENMKLKSLTVAEIEGEEKPNQLEVQKLILILNQQTSLEQLKMKNFPCCLLVAVSKLYNLKHLHLKINSFDCSKNKLCLQYFFNSLINLKHLKTLTIVPRFYMVGLNTIPEYTLKYLTTLDCSMGNCLKIVNFCTNLTKLTIRKYRLYDNLSTIELKLLSENLTNLTHLAINVSVDTDVLLLSNIKGLISLKIVGKRLTYRCLKYIKLPCLEKLIIKGTPLISYKEAAEEDVSDFEDTLKEFGRSVPALSSLSLCLQRYFASDDVQPLNFELLIPNLPRLTCFDFKPYILKAKRILLKR